MINSEIENGMHTHDSSSETIELKQRQEPEMDSSDSDFSTIEDTRTSVNEEIKLATMPILRRLRNYALYWLVETSLEPLETAKLPVIDVVTFH